MANGCYTGSCTQTGEAVDASWEENCEDNNCWTVCTWECTPGECGGIECGDNEPEPNECDGIGCENEPVECGYWDPVVNCDDCGCQFTYPFGPNMTNCCTNAIRPDQPADEYVPNGDCPPCDEAL